MSMRIACHHGWLLEGAGGWGVGLRSRRYSKVLEGSVKLVGRVEVLVEG